MRSGVSLHQYSSRYWRHSDTLGLPAACFVFARRFGDRGERRWVIYSATSGAVFLVAFFLASLAFSQTVFVDFGGLFQRLALTVGWLWLTLLALHLLRSLPLPPRGMST